MLRGHRVLAHRLRTPAAEVDLVCRRGRTLVLVEVKVRRHEGRGSAAEAIGPRQAERLRAAAEWLLARSDWACDARVDLVAFDGLRVHHVRNACAP